MLSTGYLNSDPRSIENQKQTLPLLRRSTIELASEHIVYDLPASAVLVTVFQQSLLIDLLALQPVNLRTGKKEVGDASDRVQAPTKEEEKKKKKKKKEEKKKRYRA